MFRKIFLLFSLLLIATQLPGNAAPTTSLVAIKTIPADQDIAGMLVGDSAIYLFGNTPTGGYILANNKDGSQKWIHSFSDQLELTITSGALDSSGNIWLVGASSPPKAVVSEPKPMPSGVNPDGVAIGESGPMRSDLTQLTLWKVSKTGEGVGKYQLSLLNPVLPTSININNSGISIVAWQASGSLFVSSDLTGKFGKPLSIGKNNTTLDKVIRNSDGSSILLGSSIELISATKAIGIRDGIIVKIDSAGKILQSIRSGEKSATRNWASASSTLLLGGQLKSASTNLATVTKFSESLKPTWTNRFKATSSAVVANGAPGFYYAAFANGANGSLVTFDKSGKLVVTNSFSGIPLDLQFNKSFGLYLYTSSTIYNLAIK